MINYYLSQENFSVTPLSYAFFAPDINSLKPHIDKYIDKQQEMSNLVQDVYNTKVKVKSYLQHDSVQTKQETVYIKRMASSFIMNNPSFYTRNITNNTIIEKGKGADNENLTVIYLSDGHIIKSSPKQNPEWLGTKIGEKVQKTTVIHIKNNQLIYDSPKYKPLY